MDASSSCCPQPKLQPPPPIAQVPTPTVVISIPLLPKGLLCNAIIYSSFLLMSWAISWGLPIYFRLANIRGACLSARQPPRTARNGHERLDAAGRRWQSDVDDSAPLLWTLI